MTASSFLRASLFAFAASGVAAFSSGSARAATACTQDSDCAHGLTCQVSGMTACPAIACAFNAPCPSPPACTPVETRTCMPGPCSTDSDCAQGMVCFAQTQTTCAAVPAPLPSCPPNAACAQPAFDAGGCTTDTVKSCVPTYMLPCTVDSDCGAGFTCVPDQACGCSGSSGPIDAGVSGTGYIDAGAASFGSAGGGSASSPDPGAALDASAPPPMPTPPPTANCGCTNLATSSCQAKSIMCTQDADCPATWTCVASPSVGYGCATPASLDGAAPPPCVPPPAPPSQSFCQPPYYGGPSSAPLSTGANGSVPPGAPTFGSSSGSGGSPGGGASSGSSGGPGGGSGPGGGAASGSGAAADGGAASNGPGTADQTVTAGCQLGRGRPDPSGGAWLAFLALLGLGRLRRRPHPATTR